ncbi:MAG: DUF5916 domain-containing protein [Terriglobia bacterium]
MPGTAYSARKGRRRPGPGTILGWALWWLLLGTPASSEAASDLSVPPLVTIPRVNRAPVLEDFLEMKPNGEMDGTLARVEGFIQRAPSDGQPSTQRTEVYLGYDDKNLYVVFVCFDNEPEKIRARMMPRERVFGDDIVEVMLDTFHDRRRAYGFLTNPFGIQWDGLWTEGQGWDGSFDTLWHSRGQLTDQGYVVWMSIPFKSLRFPSEPEQSWGIIFVRDIPRINEETFWPHVSNRIEGRLNQAATLQGLERISPGRNIQLIPFGVFRSFRALDTRDPSAPRFVRDPADGDAGLDAKLVFQDSLVLDLALNPDFSQVESDEPQVTINQRFEVFFPEKRPFFIENANFFETPINLLFTRRIGDPQFGARLTGKLGPYAIGAFVIDDQAPGKTVSLGPLRGKRGLFSILRVNRDFGKQSTLGLIVTDREFEDSFNRVAGLDGRFKLSENWVTSFQGVASSTRCQPGGGRSLFGSGTDGCFFNDPAEAELAGPAYDFELRRSGRSFRYRLEYNDRSPGFRTAPGFLLRPDIRRLGQNVTYQFWPEGKYLISWGPGLFFDRVYDHQGTRLDWSLSPSLQWEFTGRSKFRLFYNAGRERLRPQDFPGLPTDRDFSQPGYGFRFRSSYISQIRVSGFAGWGKNINFAPPPGQLPFLADSTNARFELTLRPWTPLRIDNSYLLLRLKDRASGANIFNNHIVRSKWNYQFNRELSLRVILQYDTTLANPNFTFLPTTKNFNADFLLTYLLNPGTVLFIGYNGNAQNVRLVNGQLLRPRDRFINDAKQFFIKFSYLFRF